MDTTTTTSALWAKRLRTARIDELADIVAGALADADSIRNKADKTAADIQYEAEYEEQLARGQALLAAIEGVE